MNITCLYQYCRILQQNTYYQYIHISQNLCKTIFWEKVSEEFQSMLLRVTQGYFSKEEMTNKQSENIPMEPWVLSLAVVLERQSFK